MNRRLEAVRTLMKEHELDALLITNPINIRYLLNRRQLFDAHFNGALLVTGGDAALLADFRYFELVEKAGLDAEAMLLTETLVATIAKLADDKKLIKIGVESGHLTVDKYLKISEKMGEKVRPQVGLVEQVRAIKDESEIEALAGAAAIGDRIFERLLGLLRPGITEREIALEIDFMMRREGAENVSFEPIVASGPNSAIPHAQAGDRALKNGDFVKLDYGCVYHGYCSDMTRTVVLGEADAEQRRLYNLVKEAQQMALDSLAVGITGEAADATARNFFARHGIADKFGHSLGHGVGLDVHELPTLGAKSEQTLKTGMVFTIEPGLYLPGYGGVRIEDMAVLRETGPEILTQTTKDLVEV